MTMHLGMRLIVADHFYKQVRNELERSDRLAELLRVLVITAMLLIGAQLASDGFPCNESAGHCEVRGLCSGGKKDVSFWQAFLFGPPCNHSRVISPSAQTRSSILLLEIF